MIIKYPLTTHARYVSTFTKRNKNTNLKDKLWKQIKLKAKQRVLS